MSNNNDQQTAMAFFFASAALAVIVVIVVLYVLSCFLAVILTILSLLAWSEPLRLGPYVIEPHEARGFIVAGCIGAVGVPVFAVFAAWLLNARIEDEWFFYLATGGYAFASIGFGLVLGALEAEAQQVEQSNTIIPPAPMPQLPPRESYRFASWDDEEARS